MAMVTVYFSFSRSGEHDKTIVPQCMRTVGAIKALKNQPAHVLWGTALKVDESKIDEFGCYWPPTEIK